jgi:hypothetical protein
MGLYVPQTRFVFFYDFVFRAEKRKQKSQESRPKTKSES